MFVRSAVRRSRRTVAALALVAVPVLALPLVALPAIAASPGTVAMDDVAVTTANTPVQIDVLANDTGTKPPAVGYFIAIATPPPSGSAQLRNGGFLYTPAAGFTGQETFRYSIRCLCDGIVTLSSANVTVTVGDPTLPALSASGAIYDRITLPLPPPGLDLSGFDLVVGDAAHGTVTRFEGGPIVYTGAFGFVGQDTVPWSITRDGSTVASSTVTVTVDGPVARPDRAETTPGTPVRIPVLDNDSGASQYRVVPGTPRFGTVQRVDGDALVYTPGPGFPESGTGEDTFAYRLRSPGNIEVTEATVTVLVHRLTARPDVAVTGPEQAVTVPVLANDDAPDGTRVEIVTPPGTGTARVEGSGIVFTPSAGFEDDSLGYVLVDAAGNRSAPATVDLHLVDAMNDDVTSSDGGPVEVDVLANDWLYGELGVEVLGEVTGGTLTGGDGRYVFTPSGSPAGIGTFRYALLDGERTLDTAVVVVRYPGTPIPSTTTTTTDPTSTTSSAEGTTTSGTTSGTTTDDTSTTTTTTTVSSGTTSSTTSSSTTSSSSTTTPVTTTTSAPPTTTTTTRRTSSTTSTRTTTRTTTRGTTAPTSRPPATTTTRDDDGGAATTTTTTRRRTTRTTEPGPPPATTPAPTTPTTPVPTTPTVVTPPAGGGTSPARTGTPSVLRLDRPSLAPGEAVEVSGSGCAVGATVRITVDGRPAGAVTAGADGSFTGEVTVGSGLGRYRLRADCDTATTETASFDTAVDVVQVQSAGGPSGAAATALLGAVAGLLSFYLLTGAVLGLGTGRRRR